jgi:signal peptidase I
MKRALLLLLIIAVCAVGYLSVWGFMPFVPAIGSGMEPELRSGSLLVTRSLSPAAIEPGDVVVFSVPRLYREDYGYPPVVARRVVEVRTDVPGWQLQTAADATGNDPFLVRMQDVRGAVSSQVPYLGLPLLVLQSRAGTFFVVFAVVLLAVFLYSGEIAEGLRRRYREFISPIVDETHRVSLVLSHRSEGTEKALESFAGAMQQYARHMASHTSAIQGLSEASQSLKDSARAQNHVLYRLTHSLETEKSGREVSRVERVVDELERRTLLVLQVKDELEGKKSLPTYRVPERRYVPEISPVIEVARRPGPPSVKKETPSVEEKPPLAEKEPPPEEEFRSPPGCFGNPKVLYARAHSFNKKS